MQGVFLFALVATIISAPDMVQGRQLSSSFLQELARMMATTDELINKGMCGDRCYVEVTENGVKEHKLLQKNERIVSPSNSCETHTCTEGGLIQNEMIRCAPLECTESNPLVHFPGRCCPICLPPNEPGECEFTPWSEFGRCSVTCGGGLRVRVREVISVDNSGSSIDCQGRLRDFERCNEQPCPVDCKYEERTEGSCVPNCGGGEIRKFIAITQLPMHGGRPCPPTDVEVTKCCQNCEFKKGCGKCSTTCNGGTRTCTPIITKPAVGGGRACPAPQIERCNENIPCPELCEGDLKPCRSSSGGYVCINDTDGDCVPDEEDNCVKVINPEQKDLDRDGVGDKCDNCPKAQNPNQENSDNDTTGDACDADDDNDGKLDQNDNCPRNANPSQADGDKDKVGDACDNCPNIKNSNQADIDEDGVGNACDNCRFYPNPDQLGTDRRTYGTNCTVKPKGLAEVEEEDIEYEENKKNMIVQMMEKLLEMYYSN